MIPGTSSTGDPSSFTQSNTGAGLPNAVHGTLAPLVLANANELGGSERKIGPRRESRGDSVVLAEKYEFIPVSELL